jgi:hypothetical protein
MNTKVVVVHGTVKGLSIEPESASQVGRAVGVHLPNQTEDEWFGQSGLAMGGLRCDEIADQQKVRAPLAFKNHVEAVLWRVQGSEPGISCQPRVCLPISLC